MKHNVYRTPIIVFVAYVMHGLVQASAQAQFLAEDFLFPVSYKNRLLSVAAFPYSFMIGWQSLRASDNERDTLWEVSSG